MLSTIKIGKSAKVFLWRQEPKMSKMAPLTPLKGQKEGPDWKFNSCTVFGRSKSVGGPSFRSEFGLVLVHLSMRSRISDVSSKFSRALLTEFRGAAKPRVQANLWGAGRGGDRFARSGSGNQIEPHMRKKKHSHPTRRYVLTESTQSNSICS